MKLSFNSASVLHIPIEHKNLIEALPGVYFLIIREKSPKLESPPRSRPRPRV